jgi:choline dehydrogenase
MVESIEWMRRIFNEEPLRSIVLKEDFPGPGLQTRTQLAEFVRRNARTMCHPVGTCRMGNGAEAVVDASLRVHGIEGLRVIDSSVMPDIVSGNTAAATYMLAERGAHMVRAT